MAKETLPWLININRAGMEDGAVIGGMAMVTEGITADLLEPLHQDGHGAIGVVAIFRRPDITIIADGSLSAVYEDASMPLRR